MAIVRTPIDFSPDAGEYLSRQLEGAGCKNWYGTVSDKGKFQLPLLPFPGSELWSDDGSSSAVRFLYSLNGVLYAVVGNKFRIYNDAGGYRDLGTLSTTSGRLFMIANDTQILVNDFQNGYVYQIIASTSRTAGSFFRIENATSFISVPLFSGSGLNDIVVSGNYTGGSSKNYKVQIDGTSTQFLTALVYSGSGSNTVTISGVYNDNTAKVYVIEIDSHGSGYDTFKWSDSNGDAWNEELVPITALEQALNSSLSVLFSGVTGYTIGDSWTLTANPDGLYDTFRWSDTNGVTWNASNVTITGGAQTLNDGIQVSFLHQSGHTNQDAWTFNTTTDSAFYPPLVPAYLDTYGAFIKQNSKRFYLTKSEDFSQINALTFAQANSWPDNLVAAITINQELILLCNKSIEFWYDTGAVGFPFVKRPNLLVPYGCVAPYSLAMGAQNVIFWVGQSINGGRLVLAMSGYEVQVISNEALNQKMQEYTNIQNAFGFIIGWQGHIFYFLTFPDNDVTWVYDLSTKRWTQRTTVRKPAEIPTNEYIEGRYLANCHVYHNDEHYVGDWSCGKIYKLSQNYYLDGTEPIICEVTTPPLHSNLDRVTIYSLQVDFQAATANSAGTGSDPMAMMQYSKAGTYGWSKELWKGMGKTGEYQRRAKWNMLGMARSRVFRIRNSDPVYRVLLGAVAELEDIGA